MATKTKTEIKAKIKGELETQKEIKREENRKRNANLREVILYTKETCPYCIDFLKMLDEEGKTVVDGYGRKITLKKAVIDHDRINELWETDFEFMEEIEEVA